ncbi:hypothetical protein Glove_553g54 [Diversispora epigaea]|uniref:Uncharacterized protein n=1 Tax=Diversispora epigaea TaxID=1348612 RepID=A0A397GEN5_9GLOM|nr:hypothetical protein Glove_553g54 [Diversispora epigaea]
MSTFYLLLSYSNAENTDKIKKILEKQLCIITKQMEVRPIKPIIRFTFVIELPSRIEKLFSTIISDHLL